MNRPGSIRTPARCSGYEENKMTSKPKPGNQPDLNDMSAMVQDGAEAHPTTTHPDLQEEAEDEAARLGDFA